MVDNPFYICYKPIDQQHSTNIHWYMIYGAECGKIYLATHWCTYLLPQQQGHSSRHQTRESFVKSLPWPQDYWLWLVCSRALLLVSADGGRKRPQWEGGFVVTGSLLWVLMWQPTLWDWEEQWHLLSYLQGGHTLPLAYIG